MEEMQSETQGIENAEIGELEAVAAKDQAKEQEDEVKTDDPVLAEILAEFDGKSKEEMARITKSARLTVGRQANELGELRKLADELLKSQLREAAKEQEKPKEVDIFENPQEAIRQAIESNPRVIAAEQYAIQVAQEQAKAKLQQLHPDFANIVQDKDFIDWINASRIRKQLFQQADKHDVEAADELFSTYKQLKVKQQRQPVSEAEAASRKRAMSAASVDASGSGDTPKKIYRRAALIRLNMTNPAQYAAMAAEIEQAYREGRVR